MCTNIILSPSQCYDSTLSARTMDFQYKVTWNVSFVPTGTSFPQKPPQKGLTWTSKYAFVGIDATGVSGLYFDGLNQEGLSAATLLLPGSVFETPGGKPTLNIGDVAAWALGTCASVEEVKAGLEGLTVLDQTIDSMSFPLHVVFADHWGKSLVVEFVNGRMNAYRSVPVLTNAPPLDWQQTNQSNYANLGLVNGPQEFFGQQLNGSGLIGIPGDFTPPSRFARASALLGSTYAPTSTQQSVGLALQLIQAVNVPYGGIQLNGNGDAIGDRTQWGVVRDHKHARYYYYSAFRNVLAGVDVKALATSTTATSIPIDTGNWYENVTMSLGGS